jgi:MFS family permease
MFTAPNNSAIMGAAPRNRQGIASGVTATARNVGMILGVGISGAIFSTFIKIRPQDGFFHGIHVAFLVACVISLLGCAASAVRGKA